MRDQVLSIDQMKHLKDLDIDTSEATLYWIGTHFIDLYRDYLLLE